jgi:NAD+ synthase
MPTTETFSLPQTQEEFYFGHPYERMDLLMWGQAQGLSPDELAERVGLTGSEVESAYAEIDRRRVATEYLHAPASVVQRH